MRRHTVDLVNALDGPVLQWSARVESWYGPERLSSAIPVGDGSTITWTSATMETATGNLSVPIGDYEGLGYRSPVGAYGQRLRPFIDITTAAGNVISTPLGWFPIEKSPAKRGIADVSIRDITWLISQARAVTPRQVPSAIGKKVTDVLCSELSGIVPIDAIDDLGAITRDTWIMRDRDAWLQSVLEAYAGYAWADEAGSLVVGSTDRYTSRVPVATLTDGVRGTLVDLSETEDASSGRNAWIVEGMASDGAPIFGGAYLTEGPMAWPLRGLDSEVAPYGCRPGFFYSPLVADDLQAKKAAESLLMVRSEGIKGSFSVEAAPDPRLQTSDVIQIVRGERVILGRITEMTLPLTAASGAMELKGVIL